MTQSASPSEFPSLNVAFTFNHEWQYGQDGKLNSFPPGGGSLGLREIEIGPVDLMGKTPAEVATIVSKRASNMAMISLAMATAQIQFADALAAVKG